MKFFKLSQDRRIPYAVMLDGVDNIAGYYDSKSGYLSDLPDQIISQVPHSPLNHYPDILDRQIFMIKGAVKEVFDLFLPGLEYKHCCLLDNTADHNEVYYIPILTVAEANEGQAQGNHIFRIANTKEIEFAASLAVIEAILRRKPEGVMVSLKG